METQAKTCQNCKKEFPIEPDDVSFYEMMHVPAPTFCPDCRLQRRLSYRNERALYKIKCALCSKDTFSIAEQGKPFTMYCADCWYGDDWDRFQYGRDYDFSRPFMAQFKELYQVVPVRARFVTSGANLVNSDFTNLVSYLKNCYLIYNSDYDEYCSYGNEIQSSKDCIDCMMVETCESCYQCLNCQKCYRAFFSVDCESSNDIWFSKNLSGCNDCFGCVNLRKKSYHIFNQPYTKEAYEKKIQELKGFTLAKAQEFWLQHPHKYIHGRQNTNVSGDYINHSKDVRNTFVATEAQNCKYCMWLLIKPVKDCWDYTEYGDGAERVIDSLTSGLGVSDVRYSSFMVKEVYDASYSGDCQLSKNIFGCVGLKNAQYCILNKQYSKEEYEALVPKIIQHMNDMPYQDAKGREYKYGEFFPIEMSRFAYNETNAQEFFPLTKEQALVKGYRWKDFEEKAHMPTKKWDEAYGLNDIVLCQAWDEDSTKAQEHNCTKAFRLTDYELQFYQRFDLPLPRQCPNTRHFERSKLRNPFKLWDRTCAKCEAPIRTSYAPERPEIVYCEECYQGEVM
ncbi:MAG: hypothetical protein AAB483_02360 [Patescibacteria group bacterium]